MSREPVLLNTFCKECAHLDLSVVDNDGWCPYCLNQKLCLDDKCDFCFIMSLASHAMAKLWHPTKNGFIRPRDVLLNDNSAFWFLCNVCGNDFCSHISYLSKNPCKICNKN